MTNEEINIAMAKACGWTDIQKYQILTEPDSPWFVSGLQPEEWKGVDIRPLLPNFCNDLNAMHEAVRIFDYEQFEEFEEHLCDICERANDEAENPAPWRFAVVHATARQRAEAFLKTLNLWKQ